MNLIPNIKSRCFSILCPIYLVSLLIFALFTATFRPALAAVADVANKQAVDGSQARWGAESSNLALQASIPVTIYMPIIHNNPPPPFLFRDDFSNASSGWPKTSSSTCTLNYVNSRYKIEIKKNDQECWSPGPSQTLVKYGLFEVKAYGEGSGNFSYGLYINGKGGGEQYLFIVRPNDSSCASGKGRYILYRTKDNSRSEKLKGCHSAVKRGTGSGAENLLAIKHIDDGKISIYANGQLLDTYTDSSQLRGEGSGLYSRSGGNNPITIRYDDFTIYKP
jgi:hypothetical protein